VHIAEKKTVNFMKLGHLLVNLLRLGSHRFSVIYVRAMNAHPNQKAEAVHKNLPKQIKSADAALHRVFDEIYVLQHPLIHGFGL
jgi:hypothetical protein